MEGFGAFVWKALVFVFVRECDRWKLQLANTIRLSEYVMIPCRIRVGCDFSLLL